MRSIRHQLLLWLLGGTLVCTTLAGVATYVNIREEANELFDYQLQQFVRFWPAHVADTASAFGQEELEEDYVIQVWNGDGELEYSSRPEVHLRRASVAGFAYQSVGIERWRVFADLRHERFVQVSLPESTRQALAAGLALRSILPLLALIPILALMIWLVVGRSLRPLHRIVEAIELRSPGALQALPAAGLPPEIQPMVEAINGLLHRLDSAMSGQRAFLADAAHALRTPLTALRLQLQLAERASTDEKRDAAFATMDRGLDRATHLVQQLLALARSEPIAATRPQERVDLLRVAQEVVADLTPLAESKGIDLGIVSPRSQTIVPGRGDDLRVLLVNLIDNALRYSGQGGQVDVLVTTERGNPVLKVTDSGPGIPLEDRDRIFERFYRLDDSGQSGSGLGLAIVKNIVERHDASIRLTEPREGSGLEVTVVFDRRSR